MTTLTAVCLTHQNVSLDLLERFPRGDAVQPTLDALREMEHVRGCLVLSTCNRFEVYITSDMPLNLPDVAVSIQPFVSAPASDWTPLLQHEQDAAAVHHLFAVASGLDSRVVGEHEILGQVRAAAHAAAQAGCLDIDLATLSQWAVRAGRRARRALETPAQHASVADHGIAVLSTLLGGLAGRRVLVLGAGHLAARATHHLAAASATTIVCARDVAKARVATEATSVVPMEVLPLLPGAVDAVICATSAPRPLMNAAMLRETSSDTARRPLLILDLAVPRNVDPDVSRLDNVICLDLDSLASYDTSAPADQIHHAAAQGVVKAEAAAFVRARAECAVADLLEHVIARAGEIRELELRRVAGRIGDKELTATDEVTRRVVNKLLHPIVTGIKAAAASGDAELARAAAEILCGRAVSMPGERRHPSQAS